MSCNENGDFCKLEKTKSNKNENQIPILISNCNFHISLGYNTNILMISSSAPAKHILIRKRVNMNFACIRFILTI